MTYYTVEQLSERLDVSKETIRRFIRTGELKAEKGSNKNGFHISEENLKEFLDRHSKYEKIFYRNVSETPSLDTSDVVELESILLSLVEMRNTLNKEIKRFCDLIEKGSI